MWVRSDCRYGPYGPSLFGPAKTPTNSSSSHHNCKNTILHEKTQKSKFTPGGQNSAFAWNEGDLLLNIKNLDPVKNEYIQYREPKVQVYLRPTRGLATLNHESQLLPTPSSTSRGRCLQSAERIFHPTPCTQHYKELEIFCPSPITQNHRHNDDPELLNLFSDTVYRIL